MGKYKRIYLGTGAGVVTVLGLFMLLTSFGLIITSDGDITCAGTLEDPCVSYITIENPTAKSIYIYNNDDIKLDFSPDIKGYELYVKYYGKWVYTNFTMETRLGNIPADRKYVFVFPRYSTKEFKLVGYKNNPTDSIKWGVGVKDDYLDPIWLSQNKLYVNKTNTGNIEFDKNNQFNLKFLDNSYFKIKYDNNNLTPSLTTKGFKTIGEKIDTLFYKIKETKYNYNKVRYISEGQISPEEMTSGYALFNYLKKTPTIRSYIPSKGYVFFGDSYYFNNINEINNSIPIIRYKTKIKHSCPVILSNRNAIVIEYHQNDLSSKDIKNFYQALHNVLSKYRIDNLKLEQFYTKNHLIYYIDGLKIKQVGRISLDKDSLILFLYIQTISDNMIEDMSLIEKIKQNYLTSLGDLQYLNENISFSIKDEIVLEFAKINDLNIELGDWTNSEQQLKQRLIPSFNETSWLIEALWSGIAEDYNLDEDKYEFEIILKERPLTNRVYFDIETEGLNFYYQPALTFKEKEEGNYRPTNIIGSYAVYYDGKKNGKYKTGKVFHIYRPRIIDNDKNWIWGDLSIDTVSGKLSITINETWLDEAIYPLIVDPTFGFDGIGGTSVIMNTYLKGSIFEGQPGEGISIVVYAMLKIDTGFVNLGLYYPNQTIVPNSTTGGFMGTVDGENPAEWWVKNFTNDLTLENINYTVVGLGESDSVGDTPSMYYDSGYTNQSVSQSSLYSLPSVGSFTFENNKYSIYVNYSEESGSDTTAPTYSNNAHNTTLNGTSVLFSITYNDNTALHPGGQYIFSTNNTGTWVNESAVNFTSTPSSANVTKTLNTTVGLVIGYRWYADDNADNINDTSIFTLTTTEESGISLINIVMHYFWQLRSNGMQRNHITQAIIEKV